MNDQLHPLLSLIDDEGWNKLGRWSRDLSVCFSPGELQVERSLCGSSMGCDPAYHTHLCTAFMELQALEIQEAAGLCSVCGAVWIYVHWFEFYTINLHGKYVAQAKFLSDVHWQHSHNQIQIWARPCSSRYIVDVWLHASEAFGETTGLCCILWLT